MTVAAVPRICDSAGDVPSPSIGSVAQTRLAGDAAATLQWLRLLEHDTGAAEVAATLGAVGALRTDLRSLRPILDKGWAVALRGGLDELAATLVAVHRSDRQARLLFDSETGASAPVRALLTALTAERATLLASVREAICPRTAAGLAFLASGREPAPLRADAPMGDPALPADVLLPPVLHRRWRKLVRETPDSDPEMMHRRATKLLVVIDVATACGIRIPGLRGAVDDLRAATDAALRLACAGDLAERLPPCPARDRLLRATEAEAEATRQVQRCLAGVAGFGPRLPVGAPGPAKTAAGGLVVRPGATEPEVLLVHRVRHDDWSIPKGATLPGETAEQCAVREVREETGLRCRLGQELGAVTYRDRNKRAKQVRFWLMTPLGRAGAVVGGEIDEVRWLPSSRAGALLTRRRDRDVLDAFRREFGPAAPSPAV